MLKQKTNSRRGFTIIEVVLVLAIAGLIFLMVFLALPALQRSQRDTERRNKLGEFKTQIVQYQSNNRGRLPGSSYVNSSDEGKLTNAWNQFIIDYLDLGKVTMPSSESGGSGESGGSASDDSLNDQFFEGSGIPDDEIPFIDPDGSPMYVKQACVLEDGKESGCKGSEVLSWEENKHQIYVFMHATCEGENAVQVDTANTRMMAFRYKLEGAGTYCGNN